MSSDYMQGVFVGGAIFIFSPAAATESKWVNVLLWLLAVVFVWLLYKAAQWVLARVKWVPIGR